MPAPCAEKAMPAPGVEEASQATSIEKTRNGSRPTAYQDSPPPLKVLPLPPTVSDSLVKRDQKLSAVGELRILEGLDGFEPILDGR